ncbi:MAG: M23 family metallopeptidase, partial [Phyllobacterium sp.]
HDLAALEVRQDESVRILANDAYESADRIRGALAAAGLKSVADDEKSGLGGPLFVAVEDSAMPFDAKIADLDEALSRLEAARLLVKSAPIANPAPGMPVSSRFGGRTDPIIGLHAFHSGMDFAAVSGTPVLATAGGTVTIADYNGGYGNMVDIDHGNGLSTRYGHMSRILVSAGQRVSRGDVVGKAGSTGRSTGAHLHYEVRRKGRPVNPTAYLRIGRQLAAEL